MCTMLRPARWTPTPCTGITLTLTDGSTVTLDQAETRTAQRYAPFAWAPLRAWLLEHVQEQHAPPGEWDASNP